MPDLMKSNMTNLKTSSNYKFSATPINEDLGSSEYTLVTIACDTSGSVAGFIAELERMVKTVVGACQKSPRSENLMLRMVTFDSRLTEIHGFKPLSNCSISDYDGCLKTGGMTALLDAIQSSVEATRDYGTILIQQEYDANGIVYVITDGHENASVATENSVSTAIKKVVHNEEMNDLTTILISINCNDPKYFEDLRDNTGMNQAVDIADATESSLAKLGKMISQSISSTSTSLNQGQNASQNASSLLII